MKRTSGMALNVFRLLSVLFTAVVMAGAFAHLFELPNKMKLAAEQYLTVQRIYRGWQLLGIPAVGALISTLAVAVMVSGTPRVFALTLAAAVCIALTLVVFFVFTYPANQQTEQWTVLPENWQALRTQWEYSHATGAALYFAALTLITLSLLVQPE